MEEINYIGEHLWPGRVGHFCILLTFLSSLVAMISYFFATQRRGLEEANTWTKMGRTAFYTHSISLMVVAGTFFYILTNNFFEYQYVWANTSHDLPFEYVFSAFWKDQEGSFMLWMLWHMVLGCVLIWKSGKWEAPVVTFVAMAQFFLSSMILGIYIGGGEDPLKFGSNPFLLLRDVMEAPIFANADYLTLIEGRGLNPSLQNYWMTIHPPTLFLGFASTIVPFAFAMAGVWTQEYKAWLKPALPWALFSATILGLGILMGGAWAYEALNFGGYWAWDPVENSSLVPWIILVAGLHTHLIANATGQSIRSTIVFYILTFVMILYSTFLTRSGVLGDTSVHSFTALGLENQLLIFIFTFLGLGFFLLFKNYKKIPAPEKEEATSSKEFWMFIGSLVLLLSAALLIAYTSLPIYNKLVRLFDPEFAGKVIKEPVEFYNQQQIWIAISMGLLSGVAQYLRFREVNWDGHKRKFLSKVLTAVAISGALTAATLLWIKIDNWQHPILLFSGLFAIISNIDYAFSFIKNNLKAAGSAVSHIGFGLMIIGIMASGLNKHHISKNELVMRDLLDNDRLNKNILLYKGVSLPMSGYLVTYQKDTLINHNRYYHVDFEKMDKEGKVTQSFTLKPNILYDQEFTKMATVNPSTKHYLHKDIFTVIASLPASHISTEEAKATEDSLKFEKYEFLANEEFFTTKFRVKAGEIDRNPTHPDYIPQEGDIALGVNLEFKEPDVKENYSVKPVIVLRGQLVYTFDGHINELGVRTRLKEETFNNILTLEEDLNYQTFTFKQGNKINFNGYEITFAGFDKEITHPLYTKEEGDIAVSAIMSIAKDENVYAAKPVYLIRDNKPFNLKDEVTAENLHVRVGSINPQNESVQISLAKGQPKEQTLVLDVAENATRSDWMVLEAIVFPGINFFWAGSLFMLFGLLMAMFRRMKEKGIISV